ncbi:OapA family protein [Reinekea blandensis]|uniref:Metalloendopeptidase-like membrane protein n=1 Tax=Reinekea blandensis MED297 TaxID=314283 RepID=A4BAH5_9GAMM|nr:peptidoglycan DD-metalloendopeptidase family protein [Reinekea blandensis]EAR10931.1 metalloendopeptidase-like membrane protein [Reinekea sp. MED297] [Reinekea blandensis MED297]
MFSQFLSKTNLLPRAHLVAVAACSTLVLIVALWPSQGQSVVVEVPAQIVVPEPEEVVEQAPGYSVTEEVQSGDTLSSVFERAGAGVSILYRLIANDDIKKPIEKIFPGQEFTFKFDDQDALVQVNFNATPLLSYQIDIDEDKNGQISKLEKTPEIHTKYATARIDDSLFMAGMEAGLSDNMIMQLATIFGWDIDFVLDIREGDEFSLLYEENYLDGEKLSDGPIIAARFMNRGREITAIRYTDESGRTDYFAPNGDSMRKAFLRTPMDVFRISSSFNPNRRHPVLNKIVAHKGTDYAAPVGTPIKATGDGKIIKAYYSSTYGNVVIIQHGAGIRTLYAHMSKFSKYSRVGNRIKQGQVIGYVGATGRVTGAHLHYEFQVHGVHKNPQTVDLPNAQPLATEYLGDFEQYASNVVGQLGVYDQAYAQKKLIAFE